MRVLFYIFLCMNFLHTVAAYCLIRKLYSATQVPVQCICEADTEKTTELLMILEVSLHHCDVIKGAMESQITSLTIVYPTVQSGADQRKHQSSASLAFVRGSHGWPVNSPHKWPVTRKMFPFDDVIMIYFLVLCERNPLVTGCRLYGFLCY